MEIAENLRNKYGFPNLDSQAENRQYASLLRGKRVAIVGPASTIRHTRQREKIESYDFVVRINSQWPVVPDLAADIGDRADIIYHCCNPFSPVEKLDRPEAAALRFVWYQSNEQSEALKTICRRHAVSHGCIDGLIVESIALLKTAPTTGFLAMLHLLATEITELYVTGFSFYATPYYRGYVGGGADPRYWRWWKRPRSRIGPHEFAPQRAYFRTLVQTDGRLKLDAPLAALVRNW